MKGFPNYLVALALVALACSIASAYDPAPLQDFSVAVNSSIDAGIYTSFFLIIFSYPWDLHINVIMLGGIT
jgi:hypothetical protein